MRNSARHQEPPPLRNARPIRRHEVERSRSMHMNIEERRGKRFLRSIRIARLDANDMAILHRDHRIFNLSRVGDQSTCSNCSQLRFPFFLILVMLEPGLSPSPNLSSLGVLHYHEVTLES